MRLGTREPKGCGREIKAEGAGAVSSLSPFLRGEGWGEGQTHGQSQS
jgi:hypothetical protein